MPPMCSASYAKKAIEKKNSKPRTEKNAHFLYNIQIPCGTLEYGIGLGCTKYKRDGESEKDQKK